MIAKRKPSTSKVTSDLKYQTIFESSPIAMWEQDFSEVKKYLTKIRSDGANNLRRFFQKNPKEVAKCAARVKVGAMNAATLTLYEAKSRKQISDLLVVFNKKSYQPFQEGLVTLSEGKTFYAADTINKTLNNRSRNIYITWSVIPNKRKDWSEVLISMVDLTDYCKARDRLLESYKYLGSINRRISILTDLTQTQQKNKIYQCLAESALEFSGAAGCSCYCFNSRQRQFQRVSQSPLPCEDHNGPRSFAIKATAPEYLKALIKKPKMIHGAGRDFDLRLFSNSQKIKSFMLLPLVEKKKLSGCLFLGFPDFKNFTMDELNFCDVFRGYGSFVLENAT